MKKPGWSMFAVALILLFVAVVMLPTWLKQNGVAEEQYLETSQFPVFLDSYDAFDTPLLEEAIEGKKLVLLGEEHGFAANSQVDYALLRELNSLGARYYLMETGVGAGLVYEKYMSTGSINLLNSIINQMNGTYSYTTDEFSFWQKFYSFNATQPAPAKMHMVGIDLDFQPSLAVWALIDMLPEQTAPAEIEPAINALASLGIRETHDYNEVAKTAGQLQESIQSNRAVYESYLGEKFFDFESVVININNTFQYWSLPASEQAEAREAMMLENLLRVLPRMEDSLIYGRFGKAHIYQSTFNDRVPLAARLQKDGPLAGRVMSISMMYMNGERLERPKQDQGEYTTTGYSESFRLADRMNQAAGGDITLFFLTRPETPFVDGGADNAFVDTRYIQAVILVKNAAPATEMKAASQPN